MRYFILFTVLLFTVFCFPVLAQNEEVAIGYGTQRKADITGAVATVSMDRIKERPVINFGEALAGQMAGVHVQQINGMPGGEGLMVRIRGTVSFTQSSDPLYIIDGFPVDGDAFRLISPQDIESIQVLKDASSTAIYGTRGATGVIIVTTRKGQTGKPKVSLTAQFGFQQREKEIKMMNRDQYVEWFKDGRNQAWLDQPLIAADPDPSPHTIHDPNSRRKLYPGANYQYLIPDGQDGYKYNFHDPASVAQMPDNNWQNLLFRKARIQQYDLSITGGSENTRYAFSGGYVDQEGIVRGSDYSRYNFRTSIVSQVTKFLELGANMSSFYASGREIENGAYAPVMNALSLPPIYPVKNEDGSWGSMLRNPEIISGDIPNPVAIAEEYYRWRERYGWMGSFHTEIKLLEGLKYRAIVHGKIQDNHRIRYLPSTLDLDGSAAPRTAEAEDQRQLSRTWIIEQTLNYSRIFVQKHILTLLAGHAAERNTGHQVVVEGRDFPTDLITSISGASKLQRITSAYNINNAMVSYFARANYAYDNKYMLTVSYRIDGSSRFGKKNRWADFPSASVGWYIGKEDFMKWIKPLNDMKLRASYGIAGNNITGDFRHIGELMTSYYPTGNTARLVILPSYAGVMNNDYLTCEKTSQMNLGFDLTLFHNRVHFEADFYRGKSVGLPLEVEVPLITGNSRQLQNRGQIENKGMEFLLHTSNFVGKFQWSTDFNISFNRNKVLILGPDNCPYYSSLPSSYNFYITKIGHPVASMYGFVYDGVFMSQWDLNNSIHRPSDQLGDPKYKDVNGDGALDSSDADIIGNNQPNFTGGWYNQFSYGNFSLNVQVIFSQGAQVYSLFRRMIGIYHGDRNGMIEQLNRWRSEAEPGDGWHFRPTRVPTGWQRNPNSSWIEDASYLRIRNLSLAYNFNSKIAEMLHLKGLRVYATAHNLYTFTRFSGYDPEVSTELTSTVRGDDYGGYPAARSFIFGINVVF